MSNEKKMSEEDQNLGDKLFCEVMENIRRVAIEYLDKDEIQYEIWNGVSNAVKEFIEENKENIIKEIVEEVRNQCWGLNLNISVTKGN